MLRDNAHLRQYLFLLDLCLRRIAMYSSAAFSTSQIKGSPNIAFYQLMNLVSIILTKNNKTIAGMTVNEVKFTGKGKKTSRKMLNKISDARKIGITIAQKIPEK